MLFVLLSDIHSTSKTPIARKDDVEKTFRKKFRFILKYAKKRKAVILQAGDFFHRPRDWRLLALVLDLLREYNIKVYTIYGQHDMYMYSDVEESPTSLNILDRAGYVTVLGRKPVRVDNVNIYGVSYGDKIPKPKGDNNILVIHAPISKKELFPDHDFTSPKYFMRKHPGYKLILAGDIHRQFTEIRRQQTLVNTGPLIRYDGSEYNFKHKPSAFAWNSRTLALEKLQIPHAPASKVLTRGHIEKATDISDSLQAFMAEMKKTNSVDDSMDIKYIIRQVSKKVKASKRVKRILGRIMVDEHTT